jgi:N-acetylglutamate synthase-like GNAT family acetyltransferase
MGLATLEQRLVEAVRETVERQQVEEVAALEQEEAEFQAEVNLQEIENDIVESSSDKEE